MFSMLKLDPTTLSTNRSSYSLMLSRKAMSKNSKIHICDGVLYLVKGRLQVCNFTKKELCHV